MTSTQLSVDMAWTFKLHAYDDGLGASRQEEQVLRFSELSEKPVDMEKLKKDLLEKRTNGTAGLPQDTEIATGTDPKHEDVWVGWYLPLETVPEWDKRLKGCSVERLVGAQSSWLHILVQKFGPQQTALKVICRMQTKQKGNRYYALAYPDPTTGVCKAFFLGRGTSVFFHREFRKDELASSESRESEWKKLVYAITSKGIDPADLKTTLRLSDFNLLTDVYAHLAEYVATKDESQIDAAVRIIDRSNSAPWISCVHLQNFMQKKIVSLPEAQKALEEFRAVYPYLDPGEVERLADGYMLRLASLKFDRNPDNFDLNWNVIRWFLPNIATNDKNMVHNGDSEAYIRGIDPAIETAYNDAVAKVEAAQSASIVSRSSENETPNDIEKATHGGDKERSSQEVFEMPEVRKKRKKTKKSKKRRNRETGDEESQEHKRRKVNHEAKESIEEELKEERQQFMSKLDEQPQGKKSSLFRRTMLRLHQKGRGADLLEALEKTIDEENI